MLSLSLRSKIILLFTIMGAVTITGGIMMLLYTHQIDATFNDMVKKELVLYKVARDMELALANQKGFLTYYLVDGDVKWLESLGQYRQVFRQSIDRANLLELDEKQREIIRRIENKYQGYIDAKNRVILNYQDQGSIVPSRNISQLHEKQRDVFFSLLDLCHTFSLEQWRVIEEMKAHNSERSIHLRLISYGAILLFLILSGVFFFILYRHILLPIRGLALETGSSPQDTSHDEVFSLSQSLKGMMKDFDATHDELTRSRKHLLQAERMAMVGELAAGVAHTIRNPFTSVKMRIFSLTRSLDLTDVQLDDVNVISDEIGRIDKIVQNFLEFARPPKLKLEPCSLTALFCSVATLLEYRLREYDARLVVNDSGELPLVMVDSDRIKEALVNLITNSCEAMVHGGTITIAESRDRDEELGEVAVITLHDTGPGIPESLRHKIMTPFFTTKDEGSGLGLSIVNRIVREHGGRIVLGPSVEGTTFILTIPANGCNNEFDTRY